MLLKINRNQEPQRSIAQIRQGEVFSWGACETWYVKGITNAFRIGDDGGINYHSLDDLSQRGSVFTLAKEVIINL